MHSRIAFKLTVTESINNRKAPETGGVFRLFIFWPEDWKTLFVKTF